MKSFVSIVILLFYLSVSIGVHVDVDTCCKSIAGLSIFNDKVEHPSLLADDCCSKEMVKSCCSSEAPDSEGCPSDCIFIQLFQEAPQVSMHSELSVYPVEMERATSSLDTPEETPLAKVLLWHEEPPNLATSDRLYLHFSAFVIYG